MVTTWNAISQDAIVRNGPPGQPQILYYAMVHAAVYDAVNSIDRLHAPYIAFVRARDGASKRAAVAAAAHFVLITLFPAQTQILDTAYADALASIDGESIASIADGMTVGVGAALALLDARADDGRCCLVQPYAPPIGPGYWKPAPDNPNNGQAVVPGLADVMPFTMPSPERFLPDGPPALSSDQWSEDFNEVKLVGARNSSVRYHLNKAKSRSSLDGQCVRDVEPHIEVHCQFRTALVERERQTVCPRQHDGSRWPNHQLTDSGLRIQGFWRPITAIREADTDGNPDTVTDPVWVPFVATPAFPEYTSGHTTFSGAFTRAVALFFGTDHIEVDIFSNVTRTTHTFRKLSDAVKEIIDARVYSGIRTRTGDVHGMTQGHRIAQYANKNYLR